MRARLSRDAVTATLGWRFLLRGNLVDDDMALHRMDRTAATVNVMAAAPWGRGLTLVPSRGGRR